MISTTSHDPHFEDTHPVKDEYDGDDAATIFAKLFLEQYQYNKRMREKRPHEDTLHH